MSQKYILGISAFYHDSAACLVRDGEIVAAAQEERFTRKKGDSSFPTNAIDFCLSAGGICFGTSRKIERHRSHTRSLCHKRSHCCLPIPTDGRSELQHDSARSSGIRSALRSELEGKTIGRTIHNRDYQLLQIAAIQMGASNKVG